METGKQNRRVVNVSYNLPVVFQIKTMAQLKEEATQYPYNHGVELLKNRKYVEAIKEFDMAITIKESDVDAYYTGVLQN